MSDVVKQRAVPSLPAPLLSSVDTQHQQTRLTIKVIVFSTLVTAILWCLEQFLQLRGVVSVGASRAVLALLWLFAILLSLAASVYFRVRHKWITTIAISVVLGSMLAALDKWAPVPQPSEEPEADIRVVNPLDVAIVIYNRSKAILRDPKYNLVVFDLDTRSTGPEQASLTVFVPSFKDLWLKSGAGFGPWPMFSSLPQPPKGHRLLGYVTATCPTCLSEKRYWIYVVWGKGGWYGEVPYDQQSDSKALISILKARATEIDKLVAGLAVIQKRPIKPAY